MSKYVIFNPAGSVYTTQFEVFRLPMFPHNIFKIAFNPCTF